MATGWLVLGEMGPCRPPERWWFQNQSRRMVRGTSMCSSPSLVTPSTPAVLATGSRPSPTSPCVSDRRTAFPEALSLALVCVVVEDYVFIL